MDILKIFPSIKKLKPKTKSMITSASHRWTLESFCIRRIHADYIESIYEAKELLDTMQHYDVQYDIELNIVPDTIVIRMLLKANPTGVFPGYKIECIAQSDFTLPDHERTIIPQHATREDLEHFTIETFEALQDHIMLITETMPIREYILPQPDLSGSISQQIDAFLKG